jgi:type I restriction enzyme S subunit
LAYGDALSSEAREDGNVPVVGSGGVSGTHDKSNFGAPGIVVGRKGSYGSIHWIPSGGFAIDTAYYIDKRLTSVHLKWLYYVLQAVDLRGPSQDVGVPGLSRDAAYNVLVPSPPPLEEQRRIAEFLDAETTRIDQLITLRQRLTNLLAERDNALRDGLVDKLFSSEGAVPLRRVALGIEQGTSPQCDAVPRELGEWGVLKLSAVKQGVFNPSENKRLPDDISPIEDFAVRPGDLLITRANTPNLVGDAAVVGEDSSQLLLPDLIYRVQLTGEMTAEFLMHVALSGRTRSLVEAVARGSSQTMVKLRGEDIKSWPVPRASSAQQARLVREIERGTARTQKLRQVLDQQITMLAERRQALITAAVTGQFNVTTSSGRNVTEGVSA